MEENKSVVYPVNRNSAVLEGMYKGVAGKIDEARQTFSRELQYSSTQQACAYESLSDEYKRGVETILAELRYISQQNSSIYDHGQRERNSLKDEVLETVRAMMAEAAADAAAKLESRIEQFEAELAHRAEVDYDALAAKVAELLKPEEPVEEAPAEEVVEETTEEAVPAEYREDAFDYDVLAEKIASILPEPDYDLITDKVVAALPQTDEQALAEKLAAALPQTDEQAIADRVVEAIPLTDYDLIAERVTAAFEGDATVKLNEESIEKIAQRVAELLKGQTVVVAPAPQRELAATEEKPRPAERKPAPRTKPAETEAEAEETAPAGDTEMTTRYKRSFVAKIIESDEDVKKYYSDLKNAILAYGKVRSQINWTNDRFSLGQDSIVKIGIRGKTLCAYLALDPNEFPETVYHQKFAGDTKMYEKTPMMVKIKSPVAVKRVIRLVELLMERQGAVKEPREPVDYAAQYFFRTEEELLAEGLIKTAVVEKSDLNF